MKNIDELVVPPLQPLLVLQVLSTYYKELNMVHVIISPERINHHFAFDTLNWVNHHSHCSRIQLLKTLHKTPANQCCSIRVIFLQQGYCVRPICSAEVVKYLLCIDINTRQPASKTRMAMVPPYHHFWPAQTYIAATLLSAWPSCCCHKPEITCLPVCLSMSSIFV